MTFVSLAMTSTERVRLEDVYDDALGAPPIMHECIEFLRLHGLSTQGLFRTATDEVAFQNTRVRLRSDTLNAKKEKEIMPKDSDSSQPPVRRPSLMIGKEVDETHASAEHLKDHVLLQRTATTAEEPGGYSTIVVRDVDNVASVLKLFLRDLYEPLITFDAFRDIALLTDRLSSGKIDSSEWVGEVTDVLESMPRAHRSTFFYFVEFLSEVAARSNENKMNAANLAIVFAPAVMRFHEEIEKSMKSEDILITSKMSHKVLEKIIVEIASQKV